MKMSAQMTVVAVLATLAWLGLAVWGIGGVAMFFSHGSLVIVALATVAMVIASLFSEVNLSSGEREDRANRWVIPAFGVIGLVSGFLPAYCDRVNFWTVGGEGVRWLGALLFIVGGVLRLWPVFVRWGGGSVDWWLYSRGTGWSPMASINTCAIRVIWAW